MSQEKINLLAVGDFLCKDLERRIRSSLQEISARKEKVMFDEILEVRDSLESIKESYQQLGDCIRASIARLEQKYSGVFLLETIDMKKMDECVLGPPWLFKYRVIGEMIIMKNGDTRFAKAAICKMVDLILSDSTTYRPHYSDSI